MSNRTSVTARKYRPVQALLIAATVAVAPAVAAAQYRVGNDGRALDANNRVGSGGYNTGGRTGPAVTPNDIVYGNVTAGKEFRGPVGSTDAGAFRGSTAGRVSDDFIRESAGVPLPGQPNANTNAQVARPFYGQGRAAPPPAGTVQQGFSGAYVAPLDTRAPMRSPADLRLGTVVDSPQVLPPSLGDLAVAGAPLDPSAGNTLITASPLYGVRQWSADNTTDRAVMDRFGGQGGANPLSRLDEQSLRRLRGELERSSAEGGAEQQTQPGGAIASPNLSNPQESPADARLNDRVTSPDLLSPTNDGGVVSGQSYRNRLLIAPEKQSALYAELSRRFEAEGKPVSDEEANRQFQQSRVAQDRKPPTRDQQEPQPGDPAQPTPPADAAAPQRDPTARIERPEAAAPRAIVVSSLAEGVRAKGLADLLRAAEESMRKGRFAEALDRYDQAAQVAPNNPMVALGGAFAKLGASYYGRAALDLRQVVAANPPLLLARYDLRAFYGDERLQFIVNDLKSILSSEPKASSPALLLAYIAYQTGADQRAALLLDDAERRLGQPDPTAGQMRRAWRLAPAAAPGAGGEEMNK